MSEQVRFKIEGCKVNPDLASICITFVKDENGEYVRYEDYAALKAEVERLTKLCQATSPDGFIHIRDINAAKEGKQS